MFHREFITCWTDTVSLVLDSPGGLELLIPDGVLPRTPSGEEYCAMLDDGNVAEDKALVAVMVTQAVGLGGTLSASCEQELVEIPIVLGGRFS